MKVIDLLNKIANGEDVPKKIKYRDWLYEFEKDCNDYMCQYDSLLYRENDDVKQFLNEEIEIIEEKKKIEKFEFGEIEDQEHYKFKKKINEIIDKLNEMSDDV